MLQESVAQTEADIQEAMQEVTSASAEALDPAQQETSFEEVQAAKTRRSEPSSSGPECSAFVRNLVFEINEEHLTKAFEKYGGIKDAFVARDPRGLSKG